jgi:hypothetical protein
VYSRVILIVLTCATAFYAIVWAASQDKAIYADETAFAKNFAQITRGEWTKLFIPHPPLYTSLGSLSTQIFGYTPAAMRIPGGLSFVATLWLIPLACHGLTQDPTHASRAAVIGLVIYAIHPLALQGSLLLDIDNTIFTPAMLLFVIALSRTEAWPPYQRIVAVGLSFALMLWTKLLPTPLLITISTLLIYALRRRLFVNTTVGIALGALLFGASLCIFAKLVSFSLKIFAPTFQRMGTPASGGTQKLLSRALMGGGITAVWLGFPFAIVYLVAVARRIWRFTCGLRPTPLDVLTVCSLTGLLLYSAGNELPMGFPRYHYPIFLMMVLLVSNYVAAARSQAKKPLWLPGERSSHLYRKGTLAKWMGNRKGCVQHGCPYFKQIDERDRRGQHLGYACVCITLLGTGVACAVYLALVVPDPLLPQYQLTFETNDLWQRLLFGLRSQAVAFATPFLVLYLALRAATRNSTRAFLGACVAFSLVSWGVLTITQSRAEYATIYEYGRQGTTALSAAVRERTDATDTIVAPSEVIFASGRNGHNVLSYVGPGCDAQKWLRLFESQPPAAYVLTTKEDARYTQVTRDPRVIALLDRCYPNRVFLGTYLAYFRAPASCP